MITKLQFRPYQCALPVRPMQYGWRTLFRVRTISTNEGIGKWVSHARTTRISWHMGKSQHGFTHLRKGLERGVRDP